MQAAQLRLPGKKKRRVGVDGCVGGGKSPVPALSGGFHSPFTPPFLADWPSLHLNYLIVVGVDWLVQRTRLPFWGVDLVPVSSDPSLLTE